ncbi:MAG: SRPBCC domain-containing protein [Stenotrophomonas koreensis]
MTPTWILIATVLAGGLALPARAEVRQASANGFELENSALVQAPADKVWEAMTAGIDHWWPKDHSWWGSESTLRLDARAGGCFCELAGERQAQHLQVALVEPGQRLRLLGGLGPLQAMGLQGVAEWTLEPQGQATRVVWRYTVGGYSTTDLTALAAVVDRVQAQQLDGLVRWAGTR